MVPFISEDIYRNLVKSIDKDAPESVHLCDFPTADESFIDKKLEEDMEELLHVVVLGRGARAGAGVKNRQPIAKMFVKVPDGLSEYFVDIIRDELNVKEVIFTDEVEQYISYVFKPQLKTLGPKYGKLLGGIRNALSAIDGQAAMKELNEKGFLSFEIDRTAVKLERDDLLIESKQTEGFEASSDYGITVVLDTTLTPELIEEGFVREIISKIQTMRKESGFEIMDNITIYQSGNDTIRGIMERNAEEIMGDTLALSIVYEKGGNSKDWNLNGEETVLGVEKVVK